MARKKSFSILVLINLLFFGSCESEDPVKTYLLSVSVSPEYSGTITYPTNPIQEGEVVELIPVPHPNWVFKQWEQDVTGTSNPLNVLMDSDKTITGVFVKRDYPLSITIQGEGTVVESIIQNPSGREYPHGTLVSLVPVPKEGWVFSEWSGDASGTLVPLQFSVDKELQITATFVPKISTLVLGGSNDDVLAKVIKVSGGRYLIAGTTNSSDGIFEGLTKGGSDAFVIQLTSELSVEWVKVFGGSKDEYASSIIENNDGTYSVSGSFSSSDGDFANKLNGTTDVFHIKLSQSGDVIWMNSFGSSNTEVFSKSMIQSKQGAYILLATSDGTCCNNIQGGNSGGKDMMTMWISPSGNLLWTRNYGTYKDEEAIKVYETSNGTIIFLGTQQPNGALNQEDLYVVATDPNGSQLSSSVYSGSGVDVGYDVVELGSQLVVLGSTTSRDGDFSNYGFGNYNMFMMKLSQFGSGLGGIRIFGGSEDDRGFSLIKSPNSNDLIVLGVSNSLDYDLDKKNIGGADLVLVKTDNNLNKKILKTYGGSNNEIGLINSLGSLKQVIPSISLSIAPNGGLILGGTTESNDLIFEGLTFGKKDIFLIKTDEDGNLN
ncbi:InlB B-repeat-containing protein [Algoriphagus halophilus]|uniref:Bacterial repeat domain-containing protein n=1 Tax=Algoriphagus halophilus TaxID=226505 RepID=A0A1N6DZ41_9BACT|nr:hypothetical protein [Algoriphagus halophilus]SIN75984.1 hypothetical protein SAMN05444394_1545 [Algoriphagus halophilus]